MYIALTIVDIQKISLIIILMEFMNTILSIEKKRWTWNPMGPPRAGSNPARSDQCLPSKIAYFLSSNVIFYFFF